MLAETPKDSHFEGQYALSVRDKSEDKGTGVIIPLEAKDVIKGDLNDEDFDPYNAYSYCKTGHPRLTLLWDENETDGSVLQTVEPQPLNWTGDLVTNPDWLQPINP